MKVLCSRELCMLLPSFLNNPLPSGCVRLGANEDSAVSRRRFVIHFVHLQMYKLRGS